MGFFGDLVDNVGTALNLPEFGFSEGANGGSSVNTGRIPATVSPLINSAGSKGVQAANNAYATKNPIPGTFLNPSYSPYVSAAPQGGVLGASTGGATAGRTAGGGTSAASYDPAALAYYNDQETLARQALDRLSAQRGIGLGNVQNSYQSALNQLLGSNAQAERDAGLTKQRTIDDNVTARSNVDQTVARQAQGLRRLLGNSSSAAQYAAPLAVAQQGNKQQGAIQTSFGRNLQNIDIADEDRKKAFGSAQEDLGNQRRQSENQLNAGLLQSEAQINEQLSNIALQRAQARGQNYAQARGQLTPFNDRVSTLLSQIDQLGANPAISARNVNFTAPTLDQYNVQGIDIAQGQTPAQAAAGQYANLLNIDERKKRNIF